MTVWSSGINVFKGVGTPHSKVQWKQAPLFHKSTERHKPFGHKPTPERYHLEGVT